MKYDFLKFNWKQISKRKLEEKIMITRCDLKNLLSYKLFFYFLGILSGISVYNVYNKFAGVLIFVVGIWMMVNTVIETERLDNDN